MKTFRDIKSLNESAQQTLGGKPLGEAKADTVDPEAYYAVCRDGGKTKVVGPYSSEAVATDYHTGEIIDVLDGAELQKSKYKGRDTSGQYRFTDVYVKRDGRWQAVTTHLSRVEKP